MPTLTHVVLANQSDLPNGYATPLPYNTIVIYPASPAGSEFATDDWLRLVFTHEFTHIVHLDRSEGWARVFRGLFGRIPIAFPNLFLPGWQLEGLASFEESAITGMGRGNFGTTSQRRTSLPPRTWAPHVDGTGAQIPGTSGNRTGNYITQCTGGAATALSVAVGHFGMTQTPVIQAFSMFCAGSFQQSNPDMQE